MEDQVAGKLQELGAEAATRFVGVKKEMERLQAANEKLMKRVEELEKQLKKSSSKNVIHEEEMWLQPEGENQPMIVVKPVKPETKVQPKKSVQVEKPVVVDEERPWLGIVPTDPDEETRNELDLPEEGGVFIEEIVGESPAEAAGLEPGDFIVAFAGVKVKSADHLRTLVGEQNAGKKVKVELVREGKRLTKSVKIGVAPRYSIAPFAPGRLSFVSALPVPSNLSELLFGDRKPQGDDKKKKKKPAKQDKRKENEPERRGFELLSELESALEAVHTFSGGEDLYIAIQDKRGNTFFRHKFEPEKMLDTLHRFIAPLFERFGEGSGWGQEMGGPMEAIWESEGPGMEQIHKAIGEFVPPDVLKRIPMFHNVQEFEGPQGSREGMREGCGCQCHGGGMQRDARKGEQPRRIKMLLGGPGDGQEPCHSFGLDEMFKGHGKQGTSSGCRCGKQGGPAGCRCGKQGGPAGCKCGKQGGPAGCKCGKQGAGRKPHCLMGGEQKPGVRVEKRMIMRHSDEAMPMKEGRMMVVSPPQGEGNAFLFEEPVEAPFAKGQRKIVRSFGGGDAFPGEVRVEVFADSDEGQPFVAPIEHMGGPEDGCFEIELEGEPGREFEAEKCCPCGAGKNKTADRMFFKKIIQPGEEGPGMEFFEGEGGPRFEFRIEQDEDNPPKIEYRKKNKKEARHRDSI
ncbi:MAG: PDZ domain-containing protein [Planctomycetota bacterium]|nr:PDZ domain-containing protein [Planctomycetota bacterium]